MTQVKENATLKPWNTFGVEARARYLADFDRIETLQQVLSDSQYRNLPRMVLGGGSNVLFTGDYEGLVLLNSIHGIEKIKEDSEYVWVKAYGGEVWHDLVEWCLERNYAGIENLSLIPGKVGAAPMQNIGAYGVELKEVFEELEAVRLKDGVLHSFDRGACKFGYRDSVFKGSEKGKYCIVSVTLRLRKKPEFNVSYGALNQTLEDMDVKELSIRAVSNAVIRIRSSKLPDPEEIGNAGSFFKNPVIPKSQFEKLQQVFPDIKHYPADKGQVKVPAGWLIEQCGWKGKRQGAVGTYPKQALIIVNYGGATGQEILDFAMQVRESVKARFGIELSPEVNVV